MNDPLDLKNPILKRYKVLQDLLILFFRCKNVINLNKIIINSDINSKINEMNIESFTMHIKNQGMWGFYNYKLKTIYYWANKNVNKEMAIHFFAHELGHHFNKKLLKIKDEEIRAETIAQICLKAVEMSKRIRRYNASTKY